MCLAIPAQVQSMNGLEAEVEIGGVSRTISLWLTPEAQVGDYVYVHTGFAISVVDEEEALQSLRLLQELAETYPVL
jgi:hydrogenase expression/formation protein HypC